MGEPSHLNIFLSAYSQKSSQDVETEAENLIKIIWARYQWMWEAATTS